MDLVVAIAAASVLLVVLAVARMTWRMWRGNEEPQPGGSMSRQVLGRSRERKPRKKKTASG